MFINTVLEDLGQILYTDFLRVDSFCINLPDGWEGGWEGVVGRCGEDGWEELAVGFFKG